MAHPWLTEPAAPEVARTALNPPRSLMLRVGGAAPAGEQTTVLLNVELNLRSARGGGHLLNPIVIT